MECTWSRCLLLTDLGPPDRLDGKWRIRYGGFDIRIYPDISTSAELSSTGVSAVLRSNHLDDPSIRYCIMVCRILDIRLTKGSDIAFIDQRHITSSVGMHMRLLLSAAS